MRERIHMICKRYKRGYKYENILNIFYYFDKLCREGNFSSPNQNELLIAQIRKTILSSQRGQIKTQKLHKNAKFPEIFDINNPIIDNPNIQNNEEDSSTEENLRAKLENLTFKSKSYFEGLFEFLNHYMETNLQNLNLKSKNELRVFIETLNSIEELFHTFEIEDDSFDPVIEKLENVLIGKVKEGPEAWLCNKIKE